MNADADGVEVDATPGEVRSRFDAMIDDEDIASSDSSSDDVSAAASEVNRDAIP